MLRSAQHEDGPAGRPAIVARPIAPPAPEDPAASLVAVRDAWSAVLLLPRRDAALDLFLVVLTTLIAHYAPAMILAAVIGWRSDLAIPEMTALAIGKWVEMTVVIGVAAYLLLRHGLPPACLGIRFDRPGMQALWALGAVAGAYAAMFATLPVALAFALGGPDLHDEIQRKREFLEPFAAQGAPLTLMLLTTVAVHEELLFRGLLLPYLRRLTGRWWAAIAVSSVVFAALHVPTQGPLSGVVLTGVGAALAVFFVLSRSLVAVCLAHLIFNLVQIQLVRLLPSLERLIERVQS